MTCRTVNKYKPGQTVTLSLALTRKGVMVDPATCVLVIHPPTGADLTPSPTHDGVGLYHYDYIIPGAGPVGTWRYRWTTTGGAADGVDEWQFLVEPLTW